MTCRPRLSLRTKLNGRGSWLLRVSAPPCPPPFKQTAAPSSHLEASRLSLPGTTEFRCTDNVDLIGNILGGTVVLTVGGTFLQSRSGPTVMHIGYVAVDDAGRASGHSQLHHRYPSPMKSEVSMSTLAASLCAHVRSQAVTPQSSQLPAVVLLARVPVQVSLWTRACPAFHISQQDWLRVRGFRWTWKRGLRDGGGMDTRQSKGENGEGANLVFSRVVGLAVSSRIFFKTSCGDLALSPKLVVRWLGPWLLREKGKMECKL